MSVIAAIERSLRLLHLFNLFGWLLLLLGSLLFVKIILEFLESLLDDLFIGAFLSMYIETDHLSWVLGHPLVRVVLQDPVMRTLPGGGHLSILWLIMDELLRSGMVGEEKVLLRACIEFI